MVTSSANDKIIAAAREAGFQISDQFGIQAGPMVVQSAAERFYAIAYRQGLEDAAKRRAPSPRELTPIGTGALLGEQQYCFNKGWKEGAASVRAAIRALMKEQNHA